MNRKKTKNNTKSKIYVMFGFEEADPQNTAYLKIETDNSVKNHSIYTIVNDIKYATKFPETNINNIKGFGTPYQWAEFFAEEEDLQDWNFHPIRFEAGNQ